MTTPQEALASALESWNAGDLDAYLRLYDDSIKLHGYAPEPMGKGDVRAFYGAIWTAFGPVRLEIHEALWDGPRAALRFTMTGRHDGEFQGIPPTGRDIALPGITVLHFRGERLVERFSSADMLGLLTQLGALPHPA